MQIFSNKRIDIAEAVDIPSLTHLLNSTYRGDVSKKGWTTEADLIAGDQRTDESGLMHVIQQPGSVILKYTNDADIIMACVNLQKQDEKLYLGMLSVSPELQGGGIGKQLLQAAEEYAVHVQCHIIYMSVISVRTELIDWYKRHGYIDTGERKEFIEDDTSGKHLQKLEFMIMEKNIEIS